MIVAMFALSSMDWIISVDVTFTVIDAVWKAQFDPQAVPRHPPFWLPVFRTILLINVSAPYKSRSSASIPELTLDSGCPRGSGLV